MKWTLSYYLTKPGLRNIPAFIITSILIFLIFYFGGSGNQVNAHSTIHLDVYAFSTQEEVLTQAIFPAFEQKWEAETGNKLSIEGVFGPSGTMAGQINLGAPADIAIFSNERHVMWIKVGKRAQIETQPVVISTTPIIIVTRPGNPKDISGFADLSKPGLHLIHANPRSSGVGEWAVFAEYGNAYLTSRNMADAEQELKNIWRNVRWLVPSARSAISLFELGIGDALITYEHDAKLAKARGVPLELVIPPCTILAQHVAVIVDDNITQAERQVAEAFLQYLQSDMAQHIFHDFHHRSVTHYREEFPRLLQPFTIDDLGSWPQIYGELIISLWQKEIDPDLGLQDVSEMLEVGER